VKGERSLRKRLRYLIAYRLLFVTVLLGSFTLFEIGHWAFSYGDSVFRLIVFLYSLTILYLFLLPRVNPSLFAYAQAAVDVLSAIALIYFTGGIESWFSFVLIVVVIAAGIVSGRKAGYLAAALGGILYGLMLDLQYYGVLDIPYSAVFMEKDFLYVIFSNIMALFLCAYLTGYLVARLERATRKYEEKLSDYRELSLFTREVVESVPSGLLTADPGGRILFFNRAAESITGVEKADAVGESMEKIFPFLKGEAIETRAEGTIQSSGSVKTVGITLTRMKNPRRGSAGFIGIFQDLTEIKNIQKEMRRREKWAAIGELSASIAHEIRNPLASLRGSVEMLKSPQLSPGQKESLMDIALAETDRLNKVITDFLVYSRPARCEMEEFDLDELVATTAELLGKSAPPGIRIQHRVRGGIRLTADPRQLQQVFFNLALNAFESMGGGGGALTIESFGNGRHAGVRFSDTGPGIPAENLEKIFFPFFTTKDSGTGLGLSIAMRIAEDHGGAIKAESAPGRGSSFIVLLPRGGKAKRDER
jgi:two-component system sensor histidine kinase PilS (NtrC family)